LSSSEGVLDSLTRGCPPNATTASCSASTRDVRPQQFGNTALKGQTLSIASLSEDWIGRLVEIDSTWNPSAWSKKLFEQEFRNQHSALSGVFSESTLVGYLIAHVVCDEAHIVSLGVDPIWRRRGAGKALLSRFLTFCEQLSVSAVTLDVRVSNSVAQRLYCSFGFHPAGVRTKYYSSNGEDALSMKLLLRPR
jgi:ribosomal-protein-alanine N-acetyltransferase